jgi:hypothetical protein
MTAKFCETADIVSAIIPADLHGQANNGDWVNLKAFGRLVAILFKGIGTAGQNPVFTLAQATDNTGANSKALTFTEIWHKVGTLTAVAAWTKVTQAAAATYTHATSADKQAIIAVEMRAEQLDVSGGFTHVQLSIPDVGANAQIGGGLYLMLNPRFAGDALESAEA